MVHEQVDADQVFLDGLYDYVREFVLRLDPIPPGDLDDMTEAWLVNSNYNLKRANKLRDLWDRLKSQPLDEKHLVCKMFVKEELYPEKKHARLIISRTDEFKALVGGVVHAMEEYVYHDSPIADMFVKGRRPSDFPPIMEDLKNAYGTILETDYSSFEGSFTNEYMRHVELVLFQRLLIHYPDQLAMIESTYRDADLVRLPRGGHYYDMSGLPWIHSKNHSIKLPDDRKSGEMWTSLGNGFSNLMNMMYLAKERGVKISGFVEGDDGFFGVSNRNITSDDFKRLGFSIKMQYATRTCDLSFCGMRFSEETLTVMPKIDVLNTVGWTCSRRYSRVGKKKALKLFKAKLMSYYSMFPKSPVIAPYFHAMINQIRVKPDFGDMDEWHFRLVDRNFDFTTPPVVSMADRITFADLNGVEPSVQVSLEHELVVNGLNNFLVEFG